MIPLRQRRLIGDLRKTVETICGSLYVIALGSGTVRNTVHSGATQHLLDHLIALREVDIHGPVVHLDVDVNDIVAVMVDIRGFESSERLHDVDAVADTVGAPGSPGHLEQ